MSPNAFSSVHKPVKVSAGPPPAVYATRAWPAGRGSRSALRPSPTANASGKPRPAGPFMCPCPCPCLQPTAPSTAPWPTGHAYAVPHHPNTPRAVQDPAAVTPRASPAAQAPSRRHSHSHQHALAGTGTTQGHRTTTRPPAAQADIRACMSVILIQSRLSQLPQLRLLLGHPLQGHQVQAHLLNLLHHHQHAG